MDSVFQLHSNYGFGFMVVIIENVKAANNGTILQKTGLEKYELMPMLMAYLNHFLQMHGNEIETEKGLYELNLLIGDLLYAIEEEPSKE